MTFKYNFYLVTIFDDVEGNSERPTAQPGNGPGYHSSAEANLAGLDIHENLISEIQTKNDSSFSVIFISSSVEAPV